MHLGKVNQSTQTPDVSSIPKSNADIKILKIYINPGNHVFDLQQNDLKSDNPKMSQMRWGKCIFVNLYKEM